MRRTVLPVLGAIIMAASGQAPAYAQTGHVHLVLRMVDPVYNDFNQVVFKINVRNLGPDTATHVRTMRNALFCATVSTPLDQCVNTAPFVLRMRDIPKDGENVYGAIAGVPASHGLVLRITIQVVFVDQHDDFSTPGTCNYGQVPQDACDTAVVDLPS
ncbi:MAG TPA: hypothetical protein VIR27_12720 [Mycobacteriales bacterium]